MTRKFYAGDSYYGTNVTFDSGGWTVHVFNSKTERDDWVEDDPSENRDRRDVITAKQADRIAPVYGYGAVDYRQYHD